MKTKDVLFIAHRIPYPPDKGDKIRSYHMVRHLAQRHRVTVACMIDDPEDVRHVEALKRVVHQVFYAVRTPAAMKVRAASALTNGRPCTLPCFYSRRLQQEIDRFLDQMPVAAVLCFCSSAAEYVFRSRHPLFHGSQSVLLSDLVDVDSEKWRQYAEKHAGPRRWLYRREARLLLRYEQQILHAFDRSFLVSEEEKALLGRHGPVPKLEALANGVDLDYFTSSKTAAPQSAPPKLVFSGAMDYWPNVEGAVWFARHVLPAVRRRRPGTVLCIAGRKPHEALLALRNQPGIEVTGTLPDIRPHLSAAALCVVPLQIARGIQNKVLEGMAMEKAVVATSGAATGLKAAADKEIVVADDAPRMTDAIVELLGAPDTRRRIGANARKYVEREHSWGTHLGRLDALIEAGKGRPA